MTEPRNVFLLGCDRVHARHLQEISDAERFRFHALLYAEDLIYLEHYDFEALLDEAREVLRSFGGRVDAIINHWDFPAASMHAILCAEWRLPGPTLEAVTKCSHKYWSRVEQRKAAPASTPDFCAVDPFDDDALDRVTLELPFWVKPVKAYGSALGFKIETPEDFQRAMEAARGEIRRLGEPVNAILRHLDLPPEIAGVDGNHMVAEQLVDGTEFAPEGFVQGGRLQVHGLIDDVRGRNRSSFLANEYPSRAPRAVQERTIEISERVLRQIGFDDGCFNVEFFWDRPADRLWIVEINPRLSQSHSDLFTKVDGMSNHEVAVHIGLGEPPDFRHGAGPHECAAKFYHRRYDKTDAIATRVPTDADVARLRERQPDTLVVLKIEQGQRLSELLDEDPYSYVLAEIMIGAADHDELLQRYDEAASLLPFEFEPVAGAAQQAAPVGATERTHDPDGPRTAL